MTNVVESVSTNANDAPRTASMMTQTTNIPFQKYGFVLQHWIGTPLNSCEDGKLDEPSPSVIRRIVCLERDRDAAFDAEFDRTE